MDKKSLLSFIHYVGNSSVQGKNFSIESKNNSLILITAAGQITGTFLLESNSSDSKEQMTDNFFIGAGHAYTENTKEQSFILLKDAILRTSTEKFTYSYLYVFTDAAYDGEDIPDDDIELFLGQVDLMLRRLKIKNKEKYGHKNKK